MAALSANAPRAAVAAAVRAAVARMRSQPDRAPLEREEWRALIRNELAALLVRSLRPVINATGIVLHTNLGRAPLADAALDAIRAAAEGYSTLEYDIDSGRRGSRNLHCIPLLRELTGAEDALVVNNCAAALVLALNTFAASREALLSRGELIEIGGSFRVPEIMERSGARLVEVGTTNRTHLLDYRSAITETTAAIVKVHRSNFTMTGFVADPPVTELAALAAERKLPLVFDLGSGLLIPLTAHGFPDEPTARSAVEAGASIVVMSGDKLLGGPQAGIVVGNGELVARMRANPLARALRVDKLTLAALQATLELYRDPELAIREIPTLAMLCAARDRLEARADDLAVSLRRAGHGVSVIETVARVGAGAFPGFELPSAGIALDRDAEEIEARLRATDPPVIGRIERDQVILDLRSVPERDDEALASAALRALEP